MSTNKAEGGMSKDEALRASYWGEVLRILEQSDVALKTAGLREDCILRIEHNEARAAVAALMEREAELAARVADRESAIEAKNIDIRERDKAIRGWSERARNAEVKRDALAARVAELEEAMRNIERRTFRHEDDTAEDHRRNLFHAHSIAKNALPPAEARNG